MTDTRTRQTLPVADFLAPGELERIFAAHERKLAVEPPPVAPEDPAVVRRRLLSDRAAALLAGDFGVREVDRCRSEDPGNTPALDAAREFLAQRDRTVLVLVGGTGCGKTTAATWIAREIGGSRPGMVDATTLERRSRYNQERSEWLDERTMVVVDDLGVEPMDGKGYFRALVDELVNRAYKFRRRLVFTSNVGGADLKDRLGDRVWSRVVEVATIAACGQVDLRRGGS